MTSVQGCLNTTNLVLDYVFGTTDPNTTAELGTNDARKKWKKPIFDTFNLVRLIETLRVRILGNGNKISVELAPYTIIRFFAEKHCSVFYETALTNLELYLDPSEVTSFTTACSNTICATSHIFLGDRIKEVFKGLEIETEVPLTLPLSMHVDSKDTRDILLKNVFSKDASGDKIDTILFSIMT